MWGAAAGGLMSPSILGADGMWGLFILVGGVFAAAGLVAAMVAWRRTSAGERWEISPLMAALLSALAGLVAATTVFLWQWGLGELSLPEGHSDFGKVQVASLVGAPLLWTVLLLPVSGLTWLALTTAGSRSRMRRAALFGGTAWAAPFLVPVLIAMGTEPWRAMQIFFLALAAPAIGGAVSAAVLWRLRGLGGPEPDNPAT